MARIPDSEIERLKKEISLERLVEAHGVKLKRHGKDLIGRCPFHKDTNPSLVVTPDKNVWHCLGACQTGGSVIDWVMKVHGVSFRHAFEILRTGQMPSVPTRPAKVSTVPKLPPPVDLTSDDRALLNQVAGYYHETLKKSPEALEYLKNRGITSAEVVEKYKLGFANRTLGLRLPDKNRKAGNEIRNRLQKVGILRKETGHEHFNGSVIIPIVDEQGNVVQMYGRKITNGLRAGTPSHLYLPGDLRGVFNLQALANYPEIILCEALIDALTFLSAGFPNVTASYGAGGFTPDHWEAFRRFKTKRVLIAYDRDEAGDKGAETLAPQLMEAGIECFRVQFPRGMDANEYALKVQPSPKSLGLVIRKAVWLGKGPAPIRDDEAIVETAPAMPAVTPGSGPTAAAFPPPPEPPPVTAADRELVVPVEATSAPPTPATTEEPTDRPVEAPPAVTPPSGPAAPARLPAPELSSATADDREPDPPVLATPAPATPTTTIEKPTDRQPAVAASASPPEQARTPISDALKVHPMVPPTAGEARPPRMPSTPPAPAPTGPSTAPPPAASPVPCQPATRPAIERQGPDMLMKLGDRQYRIQLLDEKAKVGEIKVALLVTRGEYEYVDKFDLYLAPKRAGYSRQAAIELGVSEEVIKNDLGRVFRALEDLQTEQKKAALAPKLAKTTNTPGDQEAALALLRDPRLLDRILEHFRACGVVGEETNLLVGYLAAVSRFLENPMAVVIQSSSAAGKSSLMEAILAFVPDEHELKYSAMTGQSLFYMGEVDLKHKVLAIVEEEGAERASYALKLLQSEGELTIASTGKDPQTGRHVTHEYRVEGPVMIFLTTTAVDLDEELLNRCVVLTVNEDREQTRVIHQIQRDRQTLEGQLLGQDADHLYRLHKNAQRLLRPLIVANNYAPLLTFRYDQTRSRRDHPKYLTLIRAVALLYQHQRSVQTIIHRGKSIEYIEVTREDIRIAHRLAQEVLGRTLDELPPPTRRMLRLLHGWVREQCTALEMKQADFRFRRKDVRAVTGWRETQARTHLDMLVNLEYVVAHRGSQGQSFVYELVYEGQGQDGQPFLLGLVDPDTLPPMSEHDKRLTQEGGPFAEAARGAPSGSASTPEADVIAPPVAGISPEPGAGESGALSSSPTYGYDQNFADENTNFADTSRPVRGAFAAGSRMGVDGSKRAPDADLRETTSKIAKNTVPEARAAGAIVPVRPSYLVNGSQSPEGES